MQLFHQAVTSVALKKISFYTLLKQTKSSCLSRESTSDLSLENQTLGQQNTEAINFQPSRTSQRLGFNIIYKTAERFSGALCKEVSLPLEEPTYKIYLDFLELTKGWHLDRVWNYVPYIDETPLGLENYKSFCKGRSLAFEAFYGKDFVVKMPAVAAVSIKGNRFIIYFMASKGRSIFC